MDAEAQDAAEHSLRVSVYITFKGYHIWCLKTEISTLVADSD